MVCSSIKLLTADFAAAQPLCRHRRKVVDSFAVSNIHSRGRRHILVTQPEIKHVDIFLDTLFMARFRDSGNASLDMPAENDLGNALTIFRADARQKFILEDVLLSLGQGSPHLNLNARRFHVGHRLGLLEERVCFYLIERRSNFRIAAQNPSDAPLHLRKH